MGVSLPKLKPTSNITLKFEMVLETNYQPEEQRSMAAIIYEAVRKNLHDVHAGQPKITLQLGARIFVMEHLQTSSCALENDYNKETLAFELRGREIGQ